MRAVWPVLVCLGCGLPPVTEICPERFVTRSIHVENADRLDLLFVVDGSPSMVQERALVATELERMVRILTTGDRDGDGVLDFPPMRSLHVGVVSSDLGGCVPSAAAAVLRPGCSVTDRIFRFGFDPPIDEDALSSELGCAVELVATECAIEQPLEAALRALSPSVANASVAAGYVPPSGARLEGDRANAGFLRPDSVLAMVIATDEDDCSLLRPASDVPGGDVPDGCTLRSLQPLERYVDGLLQLRANPGMLFFAVLGAVPQDLPAASAPYEVMLADPRMSETLDPSGDLVPSCESPVGRGTPPRRLVQLATLLRDRGAGTAVTSICEASALPLVDPFPSRAPPSDGICLPERLDAPSEACAVELRLPAESERDADRRCSTLGLSVLGIEDGRERCEVPLVDPLAGRAGWTYGDGAAAEWCGDGSRIQIVGLDHLTDVDLTARCEISVPEGALVPAACGP